MNRYRVDWTTEVQAESHEQAAQIARSEVERASYLIVEVTRIPLDVREVKVRNDMTAEILS